ncbi:hypothetical protein Leryth_021011 [Lithospermum erythrorhizon]|nr:hypothetical protein Leryth_021011 [Lithospermum erythrorhizon]
MASTTSRRSFSGPVVRSISPTRHFSSSPSNSSSINTTFQSSLRFSLDRTGRLESSPNRSITHLPNKGHVMCKKPGGPSQRSNCTCSPTNHHGSFRCRMHKSNNNVNKTTLYCSNKVRRSAMANSLVTIGAVDGVDVVKRSLASLIRPSSHQLRRRENFQRRPSRLSYMHVPKTLN